MPSCLKKVVNAYFAPQVSGDGGKRAVPPPTLGAALLGFVRSNFLPLGEFPLVCDPSWCLIILISMAYGRFCTAVSVCNAKYAMLVLIV